MHEEGEITMVKGAIFNPDDPRHFARIKKEGNNVMATCEESPVARSENTLKILEVGHDIYDPVHYFPREDVSMDLLRRIDKTTHCPLKGDTEYFDLEINGKRVSEAAWSYVKPYNRMEIIRGYIAFDPRKVKVTEHTITE